jgi:hypothetical protein
VNFSSEKVSSLVIAPGYLCRYFYKTDCTGTSFAIIGESDIGSVIELLQPGWHPSIRSYECHLRSRPSIPKDDLHMRVMFITSF